MKPKLSLSSLMLRNIKRNKTSLLMSSIGMIVGVASLVFFISLSEGIKQVVLGRIFLIDQVEVVPPRLGFGAAQLSALFGAGPENEQLTDQLLDQLNEVEGVSGVYPKMKFTFPAFAYGGRQLLGRNVRGELIADGIDPKLVEVSGRKFLDVSEISKPSSKIFDPP